MLRRLIPTAEIVLIVVLSLVPLFATFPYRLNIFLSWEGAYRMSQGQLPYQDFGIPLGYMYWVIPAFFFKIFGAQLITLVKAQAFINLLAGLSFLSIFRSMKIDPVIRFAGLIVFCLSYSFPNYWPWYNHTVIVYQLISLAFLAKYIYGSGSRRSLVWVALSGVFIFFSFFTKQDAGAMGFFINLALLGYHCYTLRKWIALPVFLGSFVVTALACILPFVNHNFGYWFNHGQAPHTARVSFSDIFGQFLSGSQWIKFYLLIIVILLWPRLKRFREFVSDRVQFIPFLLIAGILAEAVVFQVTSYVPEDNNIFFHSFAITYILYLLSTGYAISFSSFKPALVLLACIGLWWSHSFWRYIERFVLKPAPVSAGTTTHNGYSYPNVVNKNTYMIELDTTDIPLSQWRVPELKSFRKILLPGSTVDGIERLMKMDLVRNRKDLKVLNMSELTPLAAEIPFSLETGSDYPLWFHKGVGMFDKETNMFVERIAGNHYDLVLFEYIPYLNNFYPYAVREALQQHYQLADRFVAPRKPSSHAWIEVYVRRTDVANR